MDQTRVQNNTVKIHENTHHSIFRKKQRLIVLIMIMMILSLNVPVSASEYFYHELTGSKNILYYIDSSALEYKDSINYGFGFWNNQNPNVSAYRTVTKSYSRCDCYWEEFTYSPSTIAITYCILNNQLVCQYDSDWYWCKVYFNSDWFNYNVLSYSQRKGVACHELGHLWGLDDDDQFPDRIMCSLMWRNSSVISPSANDLFGLEVLYPY